MFFLVSYVLLEYKLTRFCLYCNGDLDLHWTMPSVGHVRVFFSFIQNNYFRCLDQLSAGYRAGTQTLASVLYEYNIILQAWKS